MNALVRIFTLTVLLNSAIYSLASAQNQTVRGMVQDKDSKMPLLGATLLVLNSDPAIGTTTDLDGTFRLENVPVGRHDIQVSYIGYEPLLLSSIMVTSGKELVLNIDMVESAIKLEEVVVKAQSDKAQVLNEMASVSARSFTVEETSRYAASAFDPARMAQNFAGVSTGAGADIENEIVIRGNSPRGVLWRLEGIEIPNPNHFGSLGNSGGGISMLSSSILSNSDFYTGAFPAEFGNALSGVFDLNMRNGNNEQREASFMLGVLGVEASTEGPLRKGGRGSYLVNYRYSTLSILNAMGVSPTGDQVPEYQDVSFKINLPTKKWGTFALFGLGGLNSADFSPETDSLAWEFPSDREGFTENQKVGTIGLSHRILLSDKSYLRTVAIASYNQTQDSDFWLDANDNYRQRVTEITRATETSYRLSSTYNHKLNARNALRTGFILSQLGFQFTEDQDENGEGLRRYFDNKGNTQLVQAFAQWRHRLNESWTLNTGVHYTQLLLNGNYAIEPRAALQWQASPRQLFSASLGLHSKPEHLAVYLFDGTFPDGTVHIPARNLELTKALHAVLGYDYRLSENMRLKVEAYYQHLYDVPVEADPTSTRSIINAFDIWDMIGTEGATNDGTGRNYGLDLTLEKFFSQQYYFMVTGSLYNSKYTPQNGIEYNTRFNGNYQLNMLGGKEWKLGSRQKNILGLNGKFILSGGNRYTPIDLEASREKGEVVFDETRPFAERAGVYSRLDVGISFKINTPKVTHTIMLDMQNALNRQNVFTLYFDEDTQNIEKYYQTGLLPIFNYRVEF
ncbi:MAG: TonB-dependent receptor [Saprospiraceae bacterium]